MEPWFAVPARSMFAVVVVAVLAGFGLIIYAIVTEKR